MDGDRQGKEKRGEKRKEQKTSECVLEKFYGVLVLYIHFAFNHRSKEGAMLSSGYNLNMLLDKGDNKQTGQRGMVLLFTKNKGSLIGLSP